MGLNLRKAGFAGLALAAVLVTFRKPSAPQDTSLAATHDERFQALQSAKGTAQTVWATLEERDSVLAYLGRVTLPAGRVSVSLQGLPKEISTRKIDSLVDIVWQRLGPTDSNVRVAVVGYNERQFSWGRYSGAFIHADGSQTTCVAIVPVFASRRGLEVYHQTLYEALAPCTLLVAFGAPGRGVASWLGETRYVSAQSTNWLLRPASFHEGEGPWNWWGVSGLRDRGMDLLSLMEPIGMADIAVGMTPPYSYGVVGLRCLRGDQDQCERAVLHPDMSGRLAAEIPTDLTLSRRLSYPDSVSMGSVRSPVPTLVSGMISSFNRERFGNFWHSDRPMPEAFQQAFGMSLGAWTADWAWREWLGSNRAKYRGVDFELGVTLHPNWLVPLFGWTAISLLIAGWVAGRRRV